MLSRLRILLFLLGCPFLGQALWAAPPVFQVQAGLEERKLGPYSEYFVDRSRNRTLDEVSKIKADSWTPISAERLSLGFMDSPVWVRFRLYNTLKQPMYLILQEPFPVLDEVLYFIPMGEGRYQKWRLGGPVPFEDRFIPTRSFLAPITLAPESQVMVYYRVNMAGRMLLAPGILSRAGLLRQFLYVDPFLWMYLGFLLVMFVYNLMLYGAIREQAHLYYVLFVFFLIVSQVLGNGMGYLFDLPGLNRITRILINFAIGCVAASLLQFFRAYIGIRSYSILLDRMVRIVAWIFFGLGISYTFLTPAVFGRIILYFIALGNLFTILMFAYLIFKRSRGAVFTAVAFSSFLGGSLLLSLVSLGLVPSNFFTMNSLKLGSSIQIVLLSLALADKINLSRAVTRKSEAGYRHLMLNSRNIVFTLNDDFQFETVNPAIKGYLGIPEPEIIGTNFANLISADELFALMGTQKYYNENLKELIHSAATEPLRLYIRSRLSREPVQMRLRLDYIQEERERLILGELSPVTEDFLKARLWKEKQSYVIGNSINNVEILSHRLTVFLPRFFPMEDVFAVRMCLREALLNAVEHGNLELVYDDKTKAIQKGEYFDVLKRLRQDPRFAGRKVRVQYLLGPDRVSFRISDEGPGFDYKKMLAKMEQCAREEMNPNGRGLLMIRNEFDLIEFNEKGNSVYLVRFFKSEDKSEAGS